MRSESDTPVRGDTHPVVMTIRDDGVLTGEWKLIWYPVIFGEAACYAAALPGPIATIAVYAPLAATPHSVPIMREDCLLCRRPTVFHPYSVQVFPIAIGNLMTLDQPVLTPHAEIGRRLQFRALCRQCRDYVTRPLDGAWEEWKRKRHVRS